MEYTFKELKKKYVISVSDGKKLGKITDMKITFPQNCVKSFFAENALSFCGEKYEINVCDVQKIGSDAILVKLSGAKCVKNGGFSQSAGANDNVQSVREADSDRDFSSDEYDE